MIESYTAPPDTEPICLVSYEVTCILLGGGPDSRTSFWKAYRRELELNLRTEYENYHIRLCGRHLGVLSKTLKPPVYFRKNRLISEKEIQPTLINA